jgi:serine/threonine-protein kinase
MGEVYRAQDTRLRRDVAIKVSAERFSERFETEARAIASLNHPNVCTLHDVGPNYLVMELVEGQTLAERIALGAIPLDEALAVAQQIADALEAAHEKGITHRDLKPGNIKIKPDGVVKVLDFGLAKMGGTPTAKSDNSPTVTMGATQAGVILGTAGYMSPEQARGQDADKRADIWSFGVVLYEMLTDRALFAGPTISDTLAAVLTKEPDLSLVPAKARRLLQSCLQKDPKQRLQAIGDSRLLLDDVPQPPPRTQQAWLPWAVALALVVAILTGGVGWWWRGTRPAELRPLIRMDVQLAADMALPVRAVSAGMMALSPDGTRLVVALRGADGKVRLYTRPLNQSQLTPLAGTESSSGPFFSPDGQWIGFFADGKVKKIAVEGGAAVPICYAAIMRGASWGDDGNIVLALTAGAPLSRVPSPGGTPTPVTKLNSGERTHRWPQVLPGSQAVLFTASNSGTDFEDANIDAVSVKTGERKTVLRGGFSGRYLALPNGSGRLIYLHQGTLFAAPFDLGRLAVTGTPFRAVEGVSSSTTAGGDFSFSATGTLLYLVGKGRQGWTISWVDRSGKTQPLHASPGSYIGPRFSPDGKHLAFFAAAGQENDLWVKDLDRDTPRRVSFLGGVIGSPVWTPDGKHIIFKSINAGSLGLYWILADGAGEAQRLTDGKLDEVPYSISPDGKRLAFSAPGNGGSYHIFTAAIEGDPAHPKLGKPELFLGTPGPDLFPAFSPDGRWLAYTSVESGTGDVYVRPFPGPGGRWQISTGGGLFPVWSRDRRELLYRGPDQRVMVVRYTARGDSFTFDKPRPWSPDTVVSVVGSLPTWDLAPDGKRLAAFLESEGEAKPATHLTFLLNFTDELQRQAGGAR